MDTLNISPRSILHVRSLEDGKYRERNTEAQLVKVGDEILISNKPRLYKQVKKIMIIPTSPLNNNKFIKNNHVFDRFTKIIDKNGEKYIEEYDDAKCILFNDNDCFKYNFIFDENPDSIVLNEETIKFPSKSNFKITLVKTNNILVS